MLKITQSTNVLSLLHQIYEKHVIKRTMRMLLFLVIYTTSLVFKLILLVCEGFYLNNPKVGTIVHIYIYISLYLQHVSHTLSPSQ